VRRRRALAAAPSPPPPSPPPPSPPLPSVRNATFPSPSPSTAPPPAVVAATLVATKVVRARVGIAGYTPTTFGATARTAFASGLATTLGAHPADVAVVNVTAYTTATSRRRLLAAGVEVGVEVVAADATAAAALNTSLIVVTTNPAVLVSALRAAGLTAVTSVEVIAAPVITDSESVTSAAAPRAGHIVALLAAALLAACATA
jgi:hypothetical protein